MRLRLRVTKSAGSRMKGLLMAFKLLETAQRRCRLNGARLLPPVRARVRFVDGLSQARGKQEKEPSDLHAGTRFTAFDNIFEIERDRQ